MGQEQSSFWSQQDQNLDPPLKGTVSILQSLSLSFSFFEMSKGGYGENQPCFLSSSLLWINNCDAWASQSRPPEGGRLELSCKGRLGFY